MKRLINLVNFLTYNSLHKLRFHLNSVTYKNVRGNQKLHILQVYSDGVKLKFNEHLQYQRLKLNHSMVFKSTLTEQQLMWTLTYFVFCFLKENMAFKSTLKEQQLMWTLTFLCFVS